MAWKLDNIDFSNYGVIVSSITGLFDSPKILNEANDWFDEDGIDYWHDIADQKYGDNKITLTCSILASTYSEFVTRLKSFYDALLSANLRGLETPYTSGVIECFLDSGISMDRLDRHSRYIESKQAGIFILSFIKPGDPDFFQLEIKRWTGTETLLVATVLTKDLKVNKTLQGEIYATCTFESNTKLGLKYFDYIRINSNGINEDTFHLPTDPEFRKLSTNKYVYTCRFEHQGSWLASSQFLNDREESDFYFHANMEEIVDLIVVNHNRSWWNNFQKGTVVATERRNHKFSGEDCLSVIRRLCKEYELEFEFEFFAASRYNINVRPQIANDKEITLEYGKGKGLYELSRGQAVDEELCTILYAYGAAKNLKPGYRDGIGRLSFTGNPLKNNDGLHDGAGPHEKTVFFDDIFPQRTATVTAYEQKLPGDPAMTVREKYLYPDGMFRVIDESLGDVTWGFDINEYLLGGLTAKIHIKTGDLAGYEFEITRYDHDTFSIYIVPFKDERGEIFPNEVLTINIGDEYTLVDIDQPAVYVNQAEVDLAAAAADYLAEFSIPKFPYRAIVDPAFMKENPGGFEVGDRINIVDADYNINGQFRISTLVFDVYKKSYEFTLSDEARLNKRQKLEMRLAAVERATQDIGLVDVEQMRKSQETTNELRNRILDPVDDKFNADRNVRNESIDPRMLAYDSGTLQWSVKGAWFYDKNNDGAEIAWTAGTFVIHNWADRTLDRYEIDKRRTLMVDYDPTRSWTITAGSFIVPALDYDTYWVYIKLDLSEGATTSVVEFYKEHKEPKLLPGFIRYKIGEFQREIVE